MIDTIKAVNGYRVCGLRKDGMLFARCSYWFTEEECTHLRLLLDGDQIVMVACLIPYSDYLKEREQNEMYHFCERFTTTKGNQFVYWRDEETGTDYITKLP